MIEKIATGISAALVLWFLASWIDVILHNTTTYIYAPWNMFTLIF